MGGLLLSACQLGHKGLEDLFEQVLVLTRCLAHPSHRRCGPRARFRDSRRNQGGIHWGASKEGLEPWVLSDFMGTPSTKALATRTQTNRFMITPSFPVPGLKDNRAAGMFPEGGGQLAGQEKARSRFILS